MEYKINDFERPSVAADAVVFGIKTEDGITKRASKIKRLKVLLVRRGEEPFKNSFSLPGGFLRKGETIEETALRELMEETGVKNPRIINLGVYSSQNRDPRGWIISCAFLALTNTVELETAESSDATEAYWTDFEYKEYNDRHEVIVLSNENDVIILEYINGLVQPNALGFDHGQIIYDAFKKLRDEVKYHNIIFDLLPEMFPISDMQKIYEAITCKNEAAAGFRRKMADKIVETEFFDEAAMHRTSRLYKKRNNI